MTVFDLFDHQDRAIGRPSVSVWVTTDSPHPGKVPGTLASCAGICEVEGVMTNKNHHSPSSTREVFSYFLRLGLFGFGGPMALIATMQKDLVEQRRWIESDQFNQAFPLIKAMPGAVGFMTAVFLGRHRAGSKGGWAAAIGLLLPSFSLMILFGAFYEQLRGASIAQAFLSGMQAGALGIIAASLKGLFWPHRHKPLFWILAIVAFALTLIAPRLEPILILSCGVGTALLFQLRERKLLPEALRRMKIAILPIFANINDLSGFLIAPASVALAKSESWWLSLAQLTWTCFKSGAFVFGSGLAIVPLMEHDFVQRLGWLSHDMFMDALAFGQITPGPVVITATFIGFKAMGLVGAIVATVAIFAPPFIHMMTWFPRFLNRLLKLSWISAFVMGAIAAVVGAIAATGVLLSQPWWNQPIQLAMISLVLVGALFTRLPAWSLIPMAGVLSWIAQMITA